MNRITVLYITGWCRSGSTLIGNILNEATDIFHTGELHFLWKNSYLSGTNSLCGCGEQLCQCPIWSQVLTRTVPEGRDVTSFAREVVGWQKKTRTRHTLGILRRKELLPEYRSYLSLLQAAYREISQISGKRILVDGGKFPSEAALLTHAQDIDVKFLHLVRNPKAVAHSWASRKSYIYRMSPFMSSYYWMGFNYASEAVCKNRPVDSIFIKYEDFIQDPQHHIAGILKSIDSEATASALVQDRTVHFHANHTVTGNPDRLTANKRVEVRSGDAAWQNELPYYGRQVTNLLCWPLARRYGY